MKNEKADELVTVRVHPRKTVLRPEQRGTRRLPDGKEVPNMVSVSVGPGEVFKTTPEEAAWLLETGFLDSPDDPTCQSVPAADNTIVIAANTDPTNPAGIGHVQRSGRT